MISNKGAAQKGTSKMKNRMITVGWLLLLGLSLVSCMAKETAGTRPEGPVSMEGVQWYLLEVAGSPVSPMAHDKQPHIMLDPVQKRASGFSGCNNFFGSYERDGESLKFGPLGATRMACPEGSLEDEFVRGLSATAIYFFRDDDLFLDLKYDSGTMRFSQQSE